MGCTYEHAGYVLTWLAAFFGPATKRDVVRLVPDPGQGHCRLMSMAPDFTVGCIEYADGVVARVTCGLVAPKDKSLTIIGDDGILMVADVRNDVCPVYVRSIPASRWRGGDRAPRQQIATVASRLGDRMAYLEPDTRWREDLPSRLRRRRQARGFLPRSSGAGRCHPRQAAMPAISGTRMAYHGADRTPAISGKVSASARKLVSTLRSDSASARSQLSMRIARFNPHSLLQRRAMDCAGDRKRACANVA